MAAAPASHRVRARHARTNCIVLGVVVFVIYQGLARDVFTLTRKVHPVVIQRSSARDAVPTNTSDLVEDSSKTFHTEAPHIRSDAAEQARNFVLARRNDYHTRGLDYRWKLRGVGYLYSIHDVILLAQLPSQGVAVLGTKQNVTIHNVSNKTGGITDCEKYSIWVRVNGPEIFAGEAQAVMSTNGTCFWIFQFDLQESGTYQVDVKLLLWNGKASIFENQCDFKPGLPSNESMSKLKHDGFQGFKMYSAPAMCCEICARTPHCISWASPFLRIIEPATVKNGCELFFEANAPDDVVPVSHLWPPRRRRLGPAAPVHGTAHTHPTSYFMGCGWSFWFTLDFPCVSGDLDDRVFSVASTFETATSAASASIRDDPNSLGRSAVSLSPDLTTLPLCTLEDENLSGVSVRGRWVREPPHSNVTRSCPPLTTTKAIDKSFQITTFEDNRPECWRRENLAIIGRQCVEMNCKLIEPESLWISSLHKEEDFAGSWLPYTCRYLELSTQQLQQCVTKRKIASFAFKGTSVAEFMNNFVQYRLLNVTLYPNRWDREAIDVVFDTLGLLHKNGPDGSFERELAKIAVAPDREEHYWISPFFLSSEREVHTHVKRMERYNFVLPTILQEKRYRTINAFDLTAAFTFDSATQNDGLHLIGPPMKAIVTKLFHHVCAEFIFTQ